jgi:hypothetical protein
MHPNNKCLFLQSVDTKTQEQRHFKKAIKGLSKKEKKLLKDLMYWEQSYKIYLLNLYS